MVVTDPQIPAPAATPAHAATALSFDGVGLVFPDGTAALDGIDLQVATGEMVAVVGPSGCGKSTLLRLAAGLLRPTAGEMLVPDDVGYVFQDPTLMPWRTVRRNVALFGELHRLPRAERERRVDEAIDLVGLRGFERHHPRRLSGGMRMRVSLARSLLLDPYLFLFDEPFAALDEITRTDMRHLLAALCEPLATTVLFVTFVWGLYRAMEVL